VGFVGTWEESLGKAEGKLGNNPRKADKNYSLSHRNKSDQSTLAAKWTVKSPLEELLFFFFFLVSGIPSEISR
jgi:hypothetical protein